MFLWGEHIPAPQAAWHRQELSPALPPAMGAVAVSLKSPSPQTQIRELHSEPHSETPHWLQELFSGDPRAAKSSSLTHQELESTVCSMKSCCCRRGGLFTLLRHKHKPRADPGPAQQLCLQRRSHLCCLPQGAHIHMCTHTCAPCPANT